MKLCMVEYQGRCDTEGKAVGHAPKVLREYYALLEDAYHANPDEQGPCPHDVQCAEGVSSGSPHGAGQTSVSSGSPHGAGQSSAGSQGAGRGSVSIEVCAPRSVLREAGAAVQHRARVLPEQIVMKGHNSLWERVANKLKMFRNIRLALRCTDAEQVWFFNTEFYLFLYLALFGNGGKQIYVSSFIGGYQGGLVARLKQWVFTRAQKRMACILSYGEGFHFTNVRSVTMRDYYYDEEKYGRYRGTPDAGEGTDVAGPVEDGPVCVIKKDVAVCLGTMGAEKQLEEMVEAFRRMDYPLVVAGRFYDTERLARLEEIAAGRDVVPGAAKDDSTAAKDLADAAEHGSRIVLRDAYLSDDEYLRLLGEAKYVVLPYPKERYAIQTSGVLQEAVFLDTVPVTYREILEGNGIPGIGIESFGLLEREALQGDTAAYVEEYERMRRGDYSKDTYARRLREVLAG